MCVAYGMSELSEWVGRVFLPWSSGPPGQVAGGCSRGEYKTIGIVRWEVIK